MLEFAFYIGNTPTFLYFDLYLNTASAFHYTTLHYTAKHSTSVTSLLVEQYRNKTVIIAEQSCSTNNVVHFCFNNVVQHWWSNNGWKKEKTILKEQACSLLLSLLLNLVNKLSQYWWLNNVVTTLLSWLNNLVNNIVYWVQHSIVQLTAQHCSHFTVGSTTLFTTVDINL